jgi:hypothetical protein
MKKAIFKYFDWVFEDSTFCREGLVYYCKNKYCRVYYYDCSTKSLRIDVLLFISVSGMFGLNAQEVFDYFRSYIVEVLGHNFVDEADKDLFFVMYSY